MFSFNVTHNVAEVIDRLNRFSKQGREAVAFVLTNTARDIQQSMPAKLETDLDRPNPFTKKGFFVKAANSSNLTALIGVMPRQAEYLKYQVFGGDRSPKRVALRLPSVVELNQYGNLPAGTVRRLLALARSGKAVNRGMAKRLKTHIGSSVYYGKPKGRRERPPGLYLRINHGGGESGKQLRPIVVFPRQSASYRKRFDFFGQARRVVTERWPVNVQRAFARALA